MNTKTALIILGVAVAIIAIIAIVSPKKDKEMETEPQIDPETGEVILGTGGPDDVTVVEGETPAVTPVAPANPDFPRTGFKPVK
jgi:hypothetical protein